MTHAARETAHAAATPRRARPGAGPVRRAALAAFVEHGFAAASVRDIADRAGVSMAAIYYHYPAKIDLLLELVHTTMDGLITVTRAARDAAGDAPAVQLAAVVDAHVRFHLEHREASFVVNTELRGLDPEQRTALVRRRDEQQRLFDAAVHAGVARGDFATPHPVEASRAVVTMTTAIAGWYRPDGPLGPSEIADRHVTLALDLVAASPTARSVVGLGRSRPSDTDGAT